MRLLMIAAAALTFALPVRAQLAPGPLAKAHRSLEGTTRCLSCHPVARRETMDQSCLACHREIGLLQRELRGLHAREGAARCASCHPDHAGTDFDLVAWTPDSTRRFDHRRAGWSLDGAHARQECADCHTSRYRHGAAAAVAPAGAMGAWTGLDPDCASCHSDVHRGRLEGACTRCHETGQWTPAPRFDHDSTRYPLSGKHRPVGCADCHRTVGNSLDPALPSISFQECSACHKDPHAGRLGRQCSECHVTTGFADRGTRTFDHNATRYPLRGRHAAAACGDCHGAAGERPRPAFNTCRDCHADAHAGTALLAGRAADCAACHDTKSFRPASYTVSDHARSRYPLEGRHAEVACRGCHPSGQSAHLGTARVNLRPGFAACSDCHADPHRGQVESGSMGCAGCHAPAGWSRSTLGPVDHAAFGFTLTERHAEIGCTGCHSTTGKAPVFKLDRTRCVDCHADPHLGRYADCTSCHTTRAFRPSTVDAAAHRVWRLPLDGAHLAVACVACHDGLERPSAGPALSGHPPAPAPLALHRPDVACRVCHTDPHAGQFLTGKVTDCETCHDPGSFRPASRFDHRRDTGFPLDRGHERTACAACHLQGRYRGTPARCEACHQ